MFMQQRELSEVSELDVASCRSFIFYTLIKFSLLNDLLWEFGIPLKYLPICVYAWEFSIRVVLGQNASSSDWSPAAWTVVNGRWIAWSSIIVVVRSGCLHQHSTTIQ